MRLATPRSFPLLCLALAAASGVFAQCKSDADCPQNSDLCVINSCNRATGLCQTNEITCDEGPCITNKCVAGNCVLTPFTCPPSNNPCQVNECVNQDGKPVCATEAVGCPSDNNCMVGQCTVQNGVGVCSYTAVPDGTGCSDGNACNQGGTCQSGMCSGAAPISCSGGAQCDPATGVCSDPPAVPALFVNGEFAGTGKAQPPSPWTVATGSSFAGFSGQTPKTYADLNLILLNPNRIIKNGTTPGFQVLTFVENAPGGAFSQTDPDTGGHLHWPRYGNQAIVVDQGSFEGDVNTLSQTATVTAGQFDPTDNQVHIRFAFAPVVGRGTGKKSDAYYFIVVTNVTQGTTLYRDFATAGNGNQPWQTNGNLDFTDWQLVSIAAGAPTINVGDSIELQIVASSGYGPLSKIWVDGVGATVPGIFVEGSAQANSGVGSGATYTLNYRNDGSQTETNVTVNFTLPAGTTYQSLNAPFGVTCTNPNIGAPGVVSCDVGTLAPGAADSLSITLSFPNAAAGALPFRNYSISSDQETTLLGSPIFVAGLGTAAAVYGPAAGAGSDFVYAAPGSAWTVATSTSWITLTNSSGTGPGLATFTLGQNSGAARSGTITVSGATFQLTLTVTQAGAGYAQATQLNTLISAAAGLGQPYGVAVDGSGNVFIADSANNAVEEWTNTNGLNTLFALTSSTDPANNLSPVGLALDAPGNVYAAIGNGGAYRSIFEWVPASGTAHGLQLMQTGPTAVAADRAGNLLIAAGELFEWSPSVGIHYNNLDSAATGVAVDLAGNVYESVAGTGIKELPAAGQASVLFSPSGNAAGLAVDGAGNVYAAIPSTSSIVEWNPLSQQATTLVASGLNMPQSVAVDAAGNVYIADTGSNAIYELPYAFVPTTSFTEGPGAGSDQLLPVVPTTAPVTASSDSAWLTIGTIANGVVPFSFTANTGTTVRVAHVTVLGQSTTITQAAAQLSAPASAGYGSTFTPTVALGATLTVLSGPCSISGSSVSVNGANGMCVIQASWGATTLTQSVTITPATAAIACVAPPANLMAWWKGDGNANDALGAFNAASGGDMGYATGEVGQAFSFDGTQSPYVSLPAAAFPSEPSTSPFTFETWFQTSSGGVILSSQGSAAYAATGINGWIPAVYVGSDGKLYTEMFYNNTVTPTVSSYPVNDGQWHHMAVTYDGTNEVTYLDGAVVGTQSPFVQAQGASTFFLGTGYTQNYPQTTGLWYTLNGLIDEATLYSRALGANEVLGIVSAGTYGKCVPQSVTINMPSGVSFTLNNVSYSGSQTVLLAPGQYPLLTPSPQSLGAGIQAVFGSWSDGGAQSHGITVGSSGLTITGTFTTQYQLTTAAGAGGTVWPASGSFYNSGTMVTVTATPNPGYYFAGWTGGPVASALQESTTIGMTGPETLTANFQPVSGATMMQGNWAGRYGADGYAIPNDATQLPAYATVSVSGDRAYTWPTPNTTQGRALQTAPGSSARIASCYFSYTNFNIAVGINDGNTHQLTLYLLDWDKTTRAETITLTDAATQAVISSQSYSSFNGGQYVSWTISSSVNIQVTNTGSPNAVVSGIFFDPVPAAASAQYSGLNTKVQGQWTGFFGTDGALIANDSAVTPPSYAEVSVQGDSLFTWKASTSDQRAPQSAAGSTNLLASAFYSNGTFSVDVNLTDGKPHRVSLYLLDWDSTARAETINILDASTLAVLDTETFSNFHGGQYASWTITGKVVIEVLRGAASNAVVSGIFFDPPPSAAFVSGQTVQGAWPGVYGQNGALIANDTAKLPALVDAQISVQGDTLWTWAGSTTDERALDTSSAGTGKIASAYYSNTSFTINVNLTDGKMHQVALYLLDWDSSTRAETITVLNTENNQMLATQSFSGFHNGTWAVLNVTGHVTIQVTKTAGSNAVVSGVFLN